MRNLLRAAVYVYPRAWRKRYGDEFEALLEDSGGGWRVLADVLWGGFTMRVKTTDFRLVAGFVLAGLAVATVISLRMPDRYRADAVVEVKGESGMSNQELVNAVIAVEQEVLSRTSLSNLIQNPALDLYRAERARMPLEDVIQQMKSNDLHIIIDAKRSESSDLVFQISYRGSDPEVARRTTQQLLTRLIDANLHRGLPGQKPVRFDVLDPPHNQVKPESPNRLLLIVGGALLGLAVGIILAGVRRWPRVAASGLAGAVLAGALSYAIPDRYESSALVMFSDPRFMSIASGMAREDLEVEKTPTGLSIRVVSPDRRSAQKAVQKVITTLFFAQTTESRISVVDPPSFPASPIFPNRLAITLIGLLAGVLAGGVWLNAARLRTS